MSFLDSDFEDTSIREVRLYDDRYEITSTDGWGFAGVTRAMVEAAGAPEPKVGDALRYYGPKFSIIRGCAINGVVMFYRTEEAQRARNEAERVRESARRQVEADASRERFDAERATMPEVFQRRLARFEKANPHWRRDFEGYEMVCCRDAVLIASALRTRDAIVAFQKQPWEEQKAAVPGLDDGHSGNTFGFAVRLAAHYVTDPENVVLEHGAMCPLVGCKEYGDDRAELAEASS